MNLIIALYTTGFQHNQIIGVQHDGYVAATMINSYKNHSFNDWSGFYLGAATGYQDVKYNFQGAIPLVAPYINYKLFQLTMFGEAIALYVKIPINI